MADETRIDLHTEPNLLNKEQKRNTVILQLRDIYGDNNIVVSDEQREVKCNYILKHDQKISFALNYDNLEDATEEHNIYQISQIYGLSDDQLSELYKIHGSSCLYLADLHIVSVSRIVVNNLDITDKILQGGVKRIRLLIPDLDLSHYEQMPEYPLNSQILLHWLPNAFWDYNFPRSRRIMGDLDTKPVLSEQDLYALLHEYGHGQVKEFLYKYSAIAGLSREQLAALRNSTEDIPYSQFNEQQREFATYTLQNEEHANANIRKLLEDEQVRRALFPGEDGLIRVEKYISNQLAPYKSRFLDKQNQALLSSFSGEKL